jgi:uncharacterized phiE125 gp8 family phage protein
MRGLTLITAPTHEPISLDEAKAHLRKTESDEDESIRSLVKVARSYIEKRMGRQLVTATWELSLPEWCTRIELPLPPLQSVVSVKYFDGAGDEQTLDSSVYEINTTAEPGILRLAYGQIWPPLRCHEDVVKIRYRSGYGDASSVPEDIKAAIKLYVGHLYENREPGSSGGYLEIPETLQALIYANKVPGLR